MNIEMTYIQNTISSDEPAESSAGVCWIWDIQEEKSTEAKKKR